jgi:hypothetical protein
LSDTVGICTRRMLLAGAGVAAAASATRGAWASDSLPPLPVPKGEAILTISGKISVHNVGNTAAFDMASLEALGLTSFTTTTPWQKNTAFRGVLFQTLMARIGASGTKIQAYALNDYVVEIPMGGFTPDGPLLATTLNGQYMPIEKFGPLFVIYDFDKHPEWLNNAMYARCIWQLQRMVIT